MSYAQYGEVAALDYNTLVGGDPTTGTGKLNSVWATGSAGQGYGQTALANVASGANVGASEWANLVNRTANAATHQNSSITSVTAPVVGGVITYNANIPTNLGTIFTNRRNAVSQGTTASNSITNSTPWTTSKTWTHTATFANGDAARYFFNCGGQLKMTMTHGNTTDPINQMFTDLCANVATVTMSVSSATANLVSKSFAGFTKVNANGSIAPPGSDDGNCNIWSNTGYFQLSTTNANVFTQTAATGPAAYLGSFIRIIAKSNGTVGLNGDVGNVITFYTLWDEVPDGLTVGSGSIVTMTSTPPETTNIANTWGTITLAGSVA